MSVRRRASFLEQYSVREPTSRLRERQAQARHHEFLSCRDNRAAIDAMIDRVRELAEIYSMGRSGAKDTLSPMEKTKLLTWASDVKKILREFEPNESHNRDPIVCMLTKLQFLQDGHVCLAEVAVDARALLERWERDGIFDTSESSEEEGEGGGGSNDRVQRKSIGTREEQRQLQHSHAYETMRQRAAGNVINRNVVLWARAQPAFRNRVEELQYFGRTTQALIKELASTANMRRPTLPSTDIFDLVKVKRNGTYAHSIGFSDLIQFSKHMALLPVDQAIRTVEDLDMKRYLFLTRCALKLQTIWRKIRREFRGRRIMKVVEAARIQHEQEERIAREERERLTLLTKGTTPESSDGKRKTIVSSKRNRSSVNTPPSTSSSSRATPLGDERLGSKRGGPNQLGRLRNSVTAVKRKESRTSSSELLGRKNRTRNN
ncbi:hypothetical protein FI667_g14516, partial [Globisporangium splendens]